MPVNMLDKLFKTILSGRRLLTLYLSQLFCAKDYGPNKVRYTTNDKCELELTLNNATVIF